MRPYGHHRSQGGSTLLEVLVTIVILAMGLLGLAGLQIRMHISEMESYQRVQAMILLEDMARRFEVNRNFAADYLTGATAPLGAGMTCPTTSATLQQRDARQWCGALQGAAEKSGTSKVGVMIGGRGCVESLGGNEYMITVAWQGLEAVSAPPASVACGKDLYDGAAASTCRADACRRTVTTIVRIAPL
ncbi:prepilin-type N-terminal cleavage/methylation domain-containing protein [Janthinobacterium sp. CG_S6]|uniref:type IV pilus modification PilV family protein n=1 Tax=unclassified Janthinobacterium TaxID=2610881 RepID=UPI00034AC32C|nr:type IV pilus assembly protein PilV [Janthinobacterium sp. CG_S6]